MPYVGDGKVPEPLNTQIRQRLRMMRTAKGLFQHDVTNIAASTMTAYETRDCSTLRLGHIHGLASDYGEDFVDFITYLVGGEGVSAELSASAKNVQRMNVMMRGLTEEEQNLALDVISTLADHLVDRRRRKPMRLRDRKARVVVEQHVADA